MLHDVGIQAGRLRQIHHHAGGLNVAIDVGRVSLVILAVVITGSVVFAQPFDPVVAVRIVVMRKSNLS